MAHAYATEEWSADERAILARYFTDVDGPVFAIVNLPEVVKGALFARYSRSPKSARRLFLDEFASDVDLGDDPERPVQWERAEALYRRVFFEYGDDSVAQVGGAHVAVEQASNVLTKILEWGRLAAYLEQSTRYVLYDQPLGGRYRYYVEPDIIAAGHGDAYQSTLDGLFATYTALVPSLTEHFEARVPRGSDDSPAVHRQAIRARVCDTLRGLLPAATLSNVGIFGSGQAYENMLLRMYASPLAEARACADALLRELRKVIPAFLARVDLPDRGVLASRYQRTVHDATAAAASSLLAGIEPDPVAEVTLTDWDPEAEVKLVAAALYPVSALPDAQLLEIARKLSPQDRADVLAAAIGDRQNRRHRPGRAFERAGYRFDILSDYGAFRDLQRHRMLTIDWQELTPLQGYETPDAIVDAGVVSRWDEAMEKTRDLWAAISPDVPHGALYVVPFAYRLRYVMQLNAREAMHMLELRTAPQGHPSYRRVCLEMHRLVAEVAGHTAVAASMRFVDRDEHELGRLDAERRAEARRHAFEPDPVG